MNKRDSSEKVKKLEEIIQKSKQTIIKEQEKIKNAQQEIKIMKELEIKGLINESKIPYDELKQLLKNYKK